MLKYVGLVGTTFSLGGEEIPINCENRRTMFRQKRRPRVTVLRLTCLPVNRNNNRQYRASEPVSDGGMFVWLRQDPAITTRRHFANLKPFGIALQYGLQLIEQIDCFILHGNQIFVSVHEATPAEDVEDMVIRAIGRASGKQYAMPLAA